MKPPPPMLPALGIRHGEREAGGDRGVDRVAALLHDLGAGLARVPRHAHHHRMLGEGRWNAGLESPVGWERRPHRGVGNGGRVSVVDHAA